MADVEPQVSFHHSNVILYFQENGVVNGEEAENKGKQKIFN